MSRPQTRPVTASALHLNWRAGTRRVRLFCAEELRPSACCIVDALHARGCEVSLFTGPDARMHLRTTAPADVLRVVWAPEVPDRTTRDRLRAGLDPESQGDVLVLGATTPRGVIEAVDAFGAPPRRRRRRSHQPRRTYLAHPTLVERSLDARGYGSGVIAGVAIAIALVAGLLLGARHSGVEVPTIARAAVERSAPPVRMRAEPVLAASMQRFDEPIILDDDEPIILDDETAFEARSEDAAEPKRRRDDAPELLAHAPLEPAPLELDRPAARPSLLPAALAASADAMPGAAQHGPGRVRTIDPF